MRARLPSAFGLWLLAAQSCSLIGLSDEIEVAACASDADCGVLNDPTRRTLDECRPYRCGDRHVCESAPLDVDRDGFIPIACERDLAKVDCNDLDPRIYPGADEFCDNQDDDCDNYVDEGVLQNQSASAVAFSGVGPVAEVAYTVIPERNTLGVAYALATAPPSVAINLLSFEGSATEMALPLTFEPLRRDPEAPAVPPSGPLHASEARFGFLAPNTFLLGSFLSDAPARTLVGAVVPSAGLFSATGRVLRYGLSCASGEACAANAQRPQQPIAAPPSSTPHVESGFDGTLAVYVRDPRPGSDLCSAGAAASHRALANLLRLGAEGLIERGTAAVELGQSAESRAPAAVSLPWLTTNGASFGWLISYPEPDGALMIAQLSGPEPLQLRPLVHLRSKGLPLRAPQFAIGTPPDAMQRTHIGLTALRGCGSESRAVFGLLEATLHTDAAIELREAMALAELGGADSQREPSLIHRDDSDSRRRGWAVSYRDASGLRARVIAEPGQLLGPEPYRLVDSSQLRADASGILALRSFLDWYAIYTLAIGADGTGTRIVRNALRSCM